MDCPDCALTYPECQGTNCPEPLYHAQGGGIVQWDNQQQAYLFVADPPMNFGVGDFMPKGWSIA